jgi:hypothetical protein
LLARASKRYCLVSRASRLKEDIQASIRRRPRTRIRFGRPSHLGCEEESRHRGKLPVVGEKCFGHGLLTLQKKRNDNGWSIVNDQLYKKTQIHLPKLSSHPQQQQLPFYLHSLSLSFNHQLSTLITQRIFALKTSRPDHLQNARLQDHRRPLRRHRSGRPPEVAR